MAYSKFYTENHSLSFNKWYSFCRVIENVIEKVVVVEKDEDCLKPPEPEVDLEELRRKEEEEK